MDDNGQASTAIWPPPGWPMFSCITRASGTATSPAPSVPGKLAVLTYKVSCYPNDEYALEVFTGSMHMNGEVSMTPALSIRFAGQEDWGAGPGTASFEGSLFEVYAHGRLLPAERQMNLRAILAITYIISRIDRGLLPDLRKTMALYRLGHNE